MAGIDNSPYIISKIDGLQGGTETVESLKTDMEDILDVARSAQSIAYTPVVGAAETIVYEKTPTAGSVELVNEFSIDLTNMVADDVLTIRLYKKLASGGAYLLASADASFTYSNAQTVLCVSPFKNVFNTYGLKIVIVQSAGTARAFQTETIDSAPGA